MNAFAFRDQNLVANCFSVFYESICPFKRLNLNPFWRFRINSGRSLLLVTNNITLLHNLLSVGFNSENMDQNRSFQSKSKKND